MKKLPPANQATNETPLHAACEENHCEIVEELIAKFPELLLIKDKIPHRGWYPIHTACAYNASDKIVAVILVGIVKISFDSPNLLNNLSFLDAFGYSPLFIAAECANFPHVSLLLHPSLISTLLHYAPSLLYSDGGLTPTKCSVIHAAIFGGNLKIINTIMSKIPKAKMSLGIPCKLTAMYVLSSLGCYLTSYSQLPMKLCENSIGELDLVPSNAVTLTHTPFTQMVLSPLALAAVLGRTEMVSVLLDDGMKDTNNLGLRLALLMKHSEIAINLLFHNKTDITAFKADGRNLLCFPVSPNLSKRLLQCSEIDLQRNSLTEIPLGLFQIPVLKYLNVSHNNLTALPVGEKEHSTSCKAAEWGWKCESLKYLHVNSNAIYTLPEAVWAIPKLECFDASYNSLKKIGQAKYRGTKLTKINISHNNITEVASFLFLSQIVNLSYNKLTSLPMELWNSKSIKTLNLSHNCIANISFSDYKEPITVSFTTACTKVITVKKGIGIEQIGTNSSLSRLELAHNRLCSFPQDLACFATHLQHLDISFNKISAIDISLLPPYLNTLVAKNCYIAAFGSIMSNEERECYYVRCVSLGIGNKCLHRRHSSLQHLTSLNLSNNKLSSMQFTVNGTTSLYPELTILNLSANELLGEFSPQVKLQNNLFSLDLSDNPHLESIPMELSLLSGTLFSLKLANLPNLRDPPREYHDIPIHSLLSYMNLRMER